MKFELILFIQLLLLLLLFNSILCDGIIDAEDHENLAAVDLLEALAFKYGTDKSKDDHKYVDVYESLFQSKRRHIKNITEIGVSAGFMI